MSSARVKRKPTISREMFCPVCDHEDTVEDFDAETTYNCEQCGAAMVVEDEANDESDEVPVLEEFSLGTGEVKKTTFREEVGERKQQERRAGLAIQRARAMLKSGDARGAMSDLLTVSGDLCLNERTAGAEEVGKQPRDIQDISIVRLYRGEKIFNVGNLPPIEAGDVLVFVSAKPIGDIDSAA